MSVGVSVVIPHYGDPEPTQALVTALRRQRGDVDVQVIVSDDCSPVPFPGADSDEVDVVRRTANGGYGAAVNSGAALARHPYLLVLNSDIEIADDFVATFLAAARAWMPAVVSTRVVESWGQRCVGRHWPSAFSNVLETVDLGARFMGRDWYEERLGNDLRSMRSDAPVVVDWAVGICLLMPTDDFRAVGGLDERFFMNCEEIDLQRRLHEQRGLPVLVLPEPVITHAGGGSSDPARRSGWLMDARMRYHEKWHGGPALYLGLMASATLNLATNGVRQVAGRDVNARRKFADEVGRYRHAWRTRR